MTEFPKGRWSLLLVGEQWPTDHDLTILQISRHNRDQIHSGFEAFAEALRSARLTSLAEQQGISITDLRHMFRRGECQALQVSEKNSVKERAYTTAYDSVLNLQHDLTELATEGNDKLDKIASSKEPETVKVAEISALIHSYRALASIAAAKYGSNIIRAIQQILDVQSNGQSAREFALRHGVDVGEMFRQGKSSEELESAVRTALKQPGNAAGIPNNQSTKPTTGPVATSPRQMVGGTDVTAIQTNLTTGSNRLHPDSLQRCPGVGSGIARNASTRPGTGHASGQILPPSQLPSSQVSAAGAPLVIPNHASIPLTAVPRVEAPPLQGASGASIAPSPPTPTISPTELAQSFNKGMESGAPFSAAAHATPSVPITSTEPQISHAAQTIPSAVASSQVHVPVVDSPPPVHHAPAAEAPPTPIVAAPQQISPPVSPQAVGPLPTYGSDLRPPVATTITAPTPPSTPLPPSATPTSAPVTPSAGQSPTNQPAVVRQTVPANTPLPTSAQGTQAVTATATGAAIGTASADSTARKRLQRLINAVARQQPRLAWAAGDRADKTTLLVTDLASGWIPPGIDLPSAVTLLPPARRRGNLEALLGDATVIASYTPIHLLPDDAEPNPTSPRPRSVPDVSDLGWELSQATQWRDGLPRLAHTLAKATSAGTGVLDSEIDLLREHLATTSKCVLDSYPDHVDAHQVGNWQLLAAIDALVGGDKATANYHLAWFLQAQI